MGRNRLTDLNSASIQVSGANVGVFSGGLRLRAVLGRGVAPMTALEVQLSIAQITLTDLAAGGSRGASSQLILAKGRGTATVHTSI